MYHLIFSYCDFTFTLIMIASIQRDLTVYGAHIYSEPTLLKMRHRIIVDNGTEHFYIINENL